MAEILLEAQAAGNLISERLGWQGGGGRHHNPSQDEAGASLLLGIGLLYGAMLLPAALCFYLLSSLRGGFPWVLGFRERLGQNGE